MRRKIFLLMIIAAIGLFYSCSNSGSKNEAENQISIDQILQNEDGTISLDIEKAARYSDVVNPSGNTAEWNVLVSKSGRYNVWLSSSTKDTTNLRYENSVMVSIMDNRLEARPECDKIIQNSSDVSLPYYRADSYIGSMYIKDTGLLNIQVISEKILPKDYKSDGSSSIEDSKLISVFLTPEKR